jgi:hypothetical protein
MAFRGARCAICGRAVRIQQPLCAKCEKEYDKPYPAWLCFLISDEKKERNHAERNRVREVPYSDEFGYESDCGLPSKHGWLAVCSELDSMGIDAEYFECCDP